MRIRFSRTVAVVYRVPTYTLFLKTAQVFGRVISVDSGAKELERSTILLLYQPSFDPAVHAAYLDIRWRPLVQHLQHLLEYFLYSTHQHQLSQQFFKYFWPSFYSRSLSPLLSPNVGYLCRLGGIIFVLIDLRRMGALYPGATVPACYGHIVST